MVGRRVVRPGREPTRSFVPRAATGCIVKLKKLEIIGFKSFVDRTVLLFDRNVTAIVGPNGCGKSNVVDALRWAMGEQSPQRLRGKSMEDVIFAGSEDRGPHGFAEVTLTFDNTDGLAPPQYAAYSEITVSRRLDRQGRSGYFVNRAPVRLQDVTELFLGTGVGRRAYSIVEQGRIGFIVTSKPEDRRLVIEEAAGITRFKARRRAAERKMEQTRQNLLRVGDVLRELEKTLASLKRQAQKAERYRAYLAEWRSLELWIAVHRWLESNALRQEAASRLDDAEARTEGVRRALRYLEAELHAERAAFDALGERLEEAQRTSYRMDNEVKLLDASLQERRRRIGELCRREREAALEQSATREALTRLHEEREALSERLQTAEAELREASERLHREQERLEALRGAAREAERVTSAARHRLAEAERRGARAEAVLGSFSRQREQATERLEALRSERSELGATVSEATERLERAEARVVECTERLDAARKALQEASTRCERLREAFHEAERAEQTLRKEHQRTRSRIESLERVHERFEGVGAGVRALMHEYAPDPASRAAKGLLGLLADRIEAEERVQRPLAAALADRLEAVLVEHEEAALGALDFLRRWSERKGKGGRATLVLRHPHGRAPVPSTVPEGAERLLDHVRVAPEDEPWARQLLGDVLLVSDVSHARRLLEGGVRAVLVTWDGTRLAPDGCWSGGGGEEGASHLLALQRELRGLRREAKRSAEALASAETERSRLQQERRAAQEAVEARREAVHREEVALVAARGEAEQLRREVRTLRERRERVEREIDSLEESLRDSDSQERSARDELGAAAEERREADAALREAEERLARRRGEMERQAQQVGRAQVSLATARQRIEADRAAHERLQRSIAEHEQRLRRLAEEDTRNAREQGRLLGEWVLAAERRGGMHRAALEAARRAELLRERHATAREALGRQESMVRRRREALQEQEHALGTLRLHVQELTLSLRHLEEQVADRHRIDLRAELTTYHARPQPGPEAIERAEQLRRLLERMGAVNPHAVEEYAEQSERFEFLTAQRADLEEALGGLEKAIRKMDRESRRLFREAFDAVAERFRYIFPQLFGGGRAELRLTDPDDLLGSGVDIVAQPPGKKLGSLELMSGGEKALTAVALIFALFQYRPSPFCVLDEVDAPLDEANIERFAQAVRQMTDRSQFILITHARRTMEYADVLYGVTMDRPGISKVVSVELRGQRRPLPSPERSPANAVA